MQLKRSSQGETGPLTTEVVTASSQRGRSCGARDRKDIVLCDVLWKVFLQCKWEEKSKEYFVQRNWLFLL